MELCVIEIFIFDPKPFIIHESLQLGGKVHDSTVTKKRKTVYLKKDLMDETVIGNQVDEYNK